MGTSPICSLISLVSRIYSRSSHRWRYMKINIRVARNQCGQSTCDISKRLSIDVAKSCNLGYNPVFLHLPSIPMKICRPFFRRPQEVLEAPAPHYEPFLW